MPDERVEKQTSKSNGPSLNVPPAEGARAAAWENQQELWGAEEVDFISISFHLVHHQLRARMD